MRSLPMRRDMMDALNSLDFELYGRLFGPVPLCPCVWLCTVGAPGGGKRRSLHRPRLKIAHARFSNSNVAPKVGLRSVRLRIRAPTITPTSPKPQLQFTASFAPAATPCELHPTSAHPPHSTSHHRECCPPVRLTLRIPERMVHA